MYVWRWTRVGRTLLGIGWVNLCHVFNSDCFSFLTFMCCTIALNGWNQSSNFQFMFLTVLKSSRGAREQRSSVVCRHCCSDNYDLFLIPPLSLPLTYLPSRVLPLVLMRPHGEQRDLPVWLTAALPLFLSPVPRINGHSKSERTARDSAMGYDSASVMSSELESSSFVDSEEDEDASR